MDLVRWERVQYDYIQIYVLQGDSGGPLTVEGDDGAHTLVGIVSYKVDNGNGYVCGEQGYDVYTSVAAFLPWIELTIKENGGMASCGFNISAPPTLGKVQKPSAKNIFLINNIGHIFTKIQL